MHFVGHHLLASFTRIEDVASLNNADLLREALLAGIAKAGATPLGWQLHQFEPQGLTILGMLAESHVSIHTYPEHRSLFLDAFTCGEECEPIQIFNALLAALGPCQHIVETLIRSEGPVRPISLH